MSKSDLSKLSKTKDGMSFDHCVGVDYGADKMAKIEQLNADLQAGRVKLPSVEWQREYMGEWVPTAEEATKRQVEQMTKRGVCPSCGKPCETTTVRDIQLSVCPCVPKDRFYLVDASKWPQYVDGPQLQAQADDAIAWARQRMEEMLDEAARGRCQCLLKAAHLTALVGRRYRCTMCGLEIEEHCQPRPVDPLDVEYDGVKLRTLLAWDEKQRTEHGWRTMGGPLTWHVWTPTQRAAVSAHWSAELRAKVEASRKADESRKASVVNAWDPEDV